jgi:hypothetical protein
MVVFRGIVVVVACCLLLSLVGGLVAAALDWLVPGYWPGSSGMDKGGPDVTVGITPGLVQGLLLGLVVGTVVVLGLAWFQQLRWVVCAQALALLAACDVVFAVGGGLGGWGLGKLAPGYFRVAQVEERPPVFPPTSAGIRRGATRGEVLGAIVGGFVVVVRAGRRRPPNLNPDIERVVRARFEPTHLTSGTGAVRASPDEMAERRD